MGDILDILDEGEIKQSKEITVRSESIHTEAANITIKNEEEYQAAAELLKAIKITRKEIDEYFDPTINKAKATVKSAQNDKKKQSEPLDLAESIIKNKMSYYFSIKEKEDQAKETERQKLMDEAEDMGEVIVAEPIEKETPKTKGISHIKVWHARVTDFAKLDDKHKLANMVQLNALAKSLKEDFNIEGAEACFEDGMRVTV